MRANKLYVIWDLVHVFICFGLLNVHFYIDDKLYHLYHYIINLFGSYVELWNILSLQST